MGREDCNVPDLAGLWSMVLSAHYRDPREQISGFGGLCWEIATLGLDIFSSLSWPVAIFGLSMSRRLIS